MTGVVAALAAFGAGLASSTGPCLAPRLAAMTATSAGHRGAARAARIVSFITGSCGGYAVLGLLAGALRRLAGWSPLTYAILAVAFAALGVASLVRRAHGPCRAPRALAKLPLSVVALAGAAFALAGSPCCGPVAAALFAAVPAADPRAVILSFAAGHALPLVAAAAGWQTLSAAARTYVPEPAVSTVGGAVALGLAGYYALLA